MPKYLISYRKVEGAGQKPEWASFTAQSEASLEAKAIRERVDKVHVQRYRESRAICAARARLGAVRLRTWVMDELSRVVHDPG